MKIFLARRLAQSVLVLLGVSFIVFFILYLTGDPALVLLPPDSSEEDVQKFRQAMGFNDPFIVQYGRFLVGALHGNFGQSVRHGEPAFNLVVERMPATFELSGAALLVALCLAIPAGIVSAVKRNTILDYISTVVALLGQSMPTFWLGIMLILVFSVQFNLLPSSGRGGFQPLVLPAITLGLFTTARITRLTRSGMLEVLSQDYIRTARAKGVSGPPVVWKHALKNAAIPIVTIVGIELGTLLGGSVITETIFAWPGRSSVGAGHLQPRLSGGAGGRVTALVDVRARESLRRRPLYVSRPADPTQVSVPISARPIDLAGTRSPARREWVVFARRLARRRTALFGLVVVTVVIVAALGAPWLVQYDPIEQDITNRLRPPGALDAAGRSHLFGTDHLGRDLLARMIFGARPALMVGFAAVAISGVLGMAVGLISGYFGGRIDDVFMRLADIQLAFPFILLAIAVIGVLGPSLPVIIVVIGVSSWVVYARVVRGAVLSLREREFVQAAHALGSGGGRVLIRHILPNAFRCGSSMLDMARVIVIEPALSFLGLGVQPPTPTWVDARRRACLHLDGVVARDSLGLDPRHCAGINLR